jgi:hypothetical protein
VNKQIHFNPLFREINFVLIVEILNQIHHIARKSVLKTCKINHTGSFIEVLYKLFKFLEVLIGLSFKVIIIFGIHSEQINSLKPTV